MTLITYSDDNMTISRERCAESALKHGIEHVIELDRNWLECTEFYQLNREILDQPRGSGYWLWKPYIIYQYMVNMKEGEYLIYSDAGVEFIRDVNHIIQRMDQDIFLFGNNWNHVDWCKMDAMQAIDPMEKWFDEYAKCKQVQASVIFIRVTQAAKEFIKEWLCYCMMPNLIDDSPSKEPNYPTFQEHRHDQAILTCLQIKHRYRLHYWPSQYNNGAFVYEKIEQYKNDDYPIMFHHTRKRNHEH